MKPRLLSFLLRLLASTWRVKVYGTKPTTPCVVAFWHDEMLPVWHVFRSGNAAGLTSSSSDGDLLAQLLLDWNYTVIRGSSSQGGREALNAMVSAASTHVVLVTPDGPRGPRHVCKPGAVIAAQRARVPLVLCRVRMRRATVLHRSWDRFRIPHPFTSIKIVFGEPVMIPTSAQRVQLEKIVQLTSSHLEQLGGDL